MTVVYGLDTSQSGSVDLYKATKDMLYPADYDLVKNVKVTLVFINPNNATQTVSWSQTINVMNNK
jgi:hypothetical protein